MSILYKGLNPKNHYGLCILTINGELITANGKHFQAIQIPKGHERLGKDFIFKKLAEWFDPPCSYIFEGKDACVVMTEKDDGKWCNENCNDDYAKCWKRYFLLLEAEE